MYFTQVLVVPEKWSSYNETERMIGFTLLERVSMVECFIDYLYRSNFPSSTDERPVRFFNDIGELVIDLSSIEDKSKLYNKMVDDPTT